MILFLHGFNSSGQCLKCQLLQKYSDKCIIPSLDLLHVQETLQSVETLIKEDIHVIIGASFGGFYAHYFAKKYNKALVLINPVLQPLDFIDKVDLQAYDRTTLINEISLISDYNASHPFCNAVELLVGLYDEIIDPKKYAALYASYPCKYYADDHRLIQGLDSYLQQSDTLLAKYL